MEKGMPPLGRACPTLPAAPNTALPLPSPIPCRHCSSLVSLSLKANPITLEALRATNGWAAHDARRTAAVGKRLAGRTGTDFDEGADPQRWLAWASQGRGVGGEGRTNGEGGR